MSLRFTRPGALSMGMQGTKDLSALQAQAVTGSRAPGAAPIEPLSRPMDQVDLEANRQISGEVAAIAGHTMPPARTTTVDTPEQMIERQRFVSTNRQMDQANVEAQNAMHFAQAVAPAQQAQAANDQFRAASSGYQQPDMTGAVADAQEFANNYRWQLMGDDSQQAVNGAISRLAQGMG